jgi:glycerophosphoryl diester phosphodiesterase
MDLFTAPDFPTIFTGRNSLRNPKFIAHRGLTTAAPENSLPAFEEAARRGMWAVETDLHLTRDGVLVCCHNATIDSMYDGAGAIADMTFAELRRFRIHRGNHAGDYPEHMLRLPLFDEYLLICRNHGAVPFMEVKADVVPQVVRAVRGFGLEEYAVISSVQFAHLSETRRLSRKIFVHHIFSSMDMLGDVAALGYSGMALDYTDLSKVPMDAVKEIHSRGVRLCFRAGDTVQAAVEMIRLGVDYIPTNRLWTLQ